MSLSITISNQIKTYNFSVCPTLPQFFEEAKKTHKSLKQNELYKKRIEVIQDFEFPTSCSQVEISEDGEYIIASGLYPPALKVYETKQLSLKCMRGLDSEAVRFCLLTPDYKKIAIAGNDRTIELQAQYGRHYRTRVPRQPTDMKYISRTCDLVISMSSNEIARLSLEQGQFLQMIELQNETIVNQLHYSPTLNLVFAGGDKQLSVIDYRQRQVTMQVVQQNQITSITSSDLKVGVGHSNGQVKVYDVRQTKPLFSFQNQYRLPIKQVELDEQHQLFIASDSKVMKFYSLTTGGLFTSNFTSFFTKKKKNQAIEPAQEINSFCKVPGSGLFLVAQEQPRVGIYFMPQLDAAPKWCPFLDNLTEELEEEENQVVYDDFKFLNYGDLEELDALHLLETKMVKPYMHGYLMHIKLYNKLSADKGFNFTMNKKRIIDQQFDNDFQKEREDKGYKQQKQQVNDDLKEVLKTKQTQLLDDMRFTKLFTEQDFQIDPTSEHWKRQHPSQAQGGLYQNEDDEPKPFKKFSTKKKIIKTKKNQ